MAGTDCGDPGSETRIYLYCLFWHFGTHSLWRDTLLSLDIVGRILVMPQSNALDFADSPLEVICLLNLHIKRLPWVSKETWALDF